MSDEKNNSKSQEDLADLMMDNIVRLGKFSYDLEEKREQSLINQASQMLMAFSVFSVAIYMILPVIIGIDEALTGKLMYCVGVVSMLLVASLILALLAQWRYKYNTMENIEVFYNKVKEEHQNYTTQAQFDMQWKEQLTAIQISKKKNNDKRVKFVIASAWLFLIAIAAVLLSAFILILISL